MKQDPLFGYRGEALVEYLVNHNIQPGDSMMTCTRIRMGYLYRMCRVVQINHVKRNKIHVNTLSDPEGRRFTWSGEATSHVKGQAWLIPVIDDVLRKMRHSSILIVKDKKTALSRLSRKAS